MMITCEKVNNATSTPLIMTPADIRGTTAEKTGEMRGEEKGRNLFGNPDYLPSEMLFKCFHFMNLLPLRTQKLYHLNQKWHTPLT